MGKRNEILFKSMDTTKKMKNKILFFIFISIKAPEGLNIYSPQAAKRSAGLKRITMLVFGAVFVR